jgi:hypothetical protein
MEKPKVIQHLILIGFKEITGEWRPIWGQGDGDYWRGKLVRGNDVIFTDINITLGKYAFNGIITPEKLLMELI